MIICLKDNDYCRKQKAGIIMVVVKAAEYYIANKKILKENAKNSYRNLPEIKKEAKREYGRNRYSNITEDKKTS